MFFAQLGHIQLLGYRPEHQLNTESIENWIECFFPTEKKTISVSKIQRISINKKEISHSFQVNLWLTLEIENLH